jgi:DNA-binding XRE family transcriptional regulator
MGLSEMGISSAGSMAQAKKSRLKREPNGAAYVALRQQLIAARRRAGLTQEQVAEQLGRPQSFMAKVERGERTIDLVEFLSIAKLVDLHVEDAISEVSKAL